MTAAMEATAGNANSRAASTGRRFINRFATAATIGTFAAVAATGVLMFFHIGDRYLHAAHDWIGMAFVIAAFFHVVRNSKGFNTLMTRMRTHAALLATAAVTALFILSAAMAPQSYGGHRHAEAAPAADVVAENSAG